LIYCLDTSALIAAWHELYPIDVFPKFWELMDQLVAEKRILAPDEVLRELAKKDDALHKWAKARTDVFVPFDESLLAKGAEITNKYRRLLEQKTGRNGADPWVIALAALRGAVLVTKEGPSGTLAKPKIPDVCQAEKIEWITVLEVIRREKWSF